MRVQAVNTNIVSNQQYARVHNVQFKAFFGKPNLAEKFQYGLEALDENSILVVTSNPEASDMVLEQCSDKILNPILTKYILKVKEEDLDKKEKIESDFAVIKHKGTFYALALGATFLTSLIITKPGGEIIPKKHMHSPGSLVPLEKGVSIIADTFSSDASKHKFLFTPPYRYNPENARKYLEVKQISDIQEFNKRTIPQLSSFSKNEERQGLTFEDIGGLDDVIETLKKYVVRPINYPRVFENIRLNKGIMLYGPPRCGKTMLGKALANEVGAAYVEYNANEFKSAQVGASEKAIRDVFDQAIANAPSITFIDEFDSIGKTRDGSSNARFDDPMVNQFLGCMSDLEKSKKPAFIVAATNMKNLIDPALLASGRFGLHLEVPMPNLEGLRQIFNIHSKKQPISGEVSVESIVPKMFAGKFNGSDVAEMISDAYFNALERLGMFAKMDAKTFGFEDFRKILISLCDFEKAISRIVKQKL